MKSGDQFCDWSAKGLPQGAQKEIVVHAGFGKKKKKNPKRCELWAGAGKRDPPERKAGRQRNEAVHTQAWEGLDLHNKPSSPDAKSLLSSPPDPVASGGWWLKQLTVWRLHTGLALEHTFLVKWRVFNLVILLSFTTLSISASWT